MAFNSLEYIYFFLIVAFLFHAISFRFRWFLLLVSSYYFYMSWKAPYAAIIIAQTLTAYGAALLIGMSKSRFGRIAWLNLGLVINIGMLAAYKYLKFFTMTFNSALSYLHPSSSPLPVQDLLLPIGISFFTFQTVAYMVDVYRGSLPPERHLGYFALFVALFPHLIAGPITRGAHILPQLKRELPYDHQRLAGGLRLILLGMFKKVVIADRLAHVVDTVYNNPANHTGIVLTVATVFFAFQIYYDFSGYVDIAIGSAQVLGVDFPDNFNSPYQAASISDFWRRWHITLMSWLRDYIYFPLGGSHHGLVRTCVNTLTTFLISGLWHGANWTYVVWGALNGLFLIIERITKPISRRVVHSLRMDRIPVLSRLYTMLCVAVTFSLICFAWIFFRANSMSDAFYIATHLFANWDKFDSTQLYAGYGTNFNRGDFYFGVACVLFLEVFYFLQRGKNLRFMLSDKPAWVRWGVSYCLLLTVLLFGDYGNKPFIYFAF